MIYFSIITILFCYGQPFNCRSFYLLLKLAAKKQLHLIEFQSILVEMAKSESVFWEVGEEA